MRDMVRKFSRGFSLMEVTLALGISSVALLSIVGLLSAAMNTSGDAGQDTALAAMAGLVTGDLHAASFDALGQASPKTPLPNLPTLPATLADSVYYFTSEGIPLTGAAAATSPDAFYQCVVSKKVDPAFRTAGGGPYNLVRVQLRFIWPYTATPDPANRTEKALFHASIARY